MWSIPYNSAYPYFDFPFGHAIQVDTATTLTPNAGPPPVEEGQIKISPPDITNADVQNRPQMPLNPVILLTSSQGIGEMDGPPLSEHPFPQISGAGSLVGCGVSSFEFTHADVQNRPQIYSFNPPIQPTLDRGISEMDELSLFKHPFPRFGDNGLPVASLVLLENSDATGSLVRCDAPPYEFTPADVRNRFQLYSFNLPIPPTPHTIPRAPPLVQRGEENEPQDRPHQSSGEASPERPAAMDGALDRPFLCDSCHKKFKQRQGLNRHYREKHKPRWCMFCDTNCSRAYLYRVHLEKCHPDVDLDPILGNHTGSCRRAAILARGSPQQPKLSPLAVAKAPHRAGYRQDLVWSGAGL
jgi:hypothetical protein